MKPALLLLLASVSLAHASPDRSRIEEDRHAKEALRELHFFSEGAGMHLAPDLIQAADPSSHLPGFFPPNWKEKWGMITGPRNKPYGLYGVEYRKMKVGVLGCVFCHGGKAAGEYVVGLGNKNVDVLALAKDVKSLTPKWISFTDKFTRKSEEHRRLEAQAMEFANTLANDSAGNLTQGLVPVSFVRSWFFKVAGIPYPEDYPKGQVKIPFLWGYGLKRKVGSFCDGYGDGVLPGWAVAVELVAGQKPETIRRYLPKVEEAEDALAGLLPPKYPFKVDVIRAERGKRTFEKTCAQCHGTYERDAEGLPVFDYPKWIPLEVVKTDDDRLNGNTEFFKHLVETSPMNDLIKTRSPGRGYFAPRLEGVWSRFPYLHNASIPNIRALLAPASKRPRAFSLKDAGERDRFDEASLGLTLPKPGSRDEKRLLKDGREGERDVYFVERVGHSNQGHEFYVDLPDSAKDEIIEYLKTL